MNKTLKPENFVYWLQGFFEISNAKTLTEEQVTIVKEHLELCFEKVVMPVTTSVEQTSPLLKLSQFLTTTPTTTIC